MKRLKIGWDNGVSPAQRQAITRTNDGYCQLDSYEQISLKLWSKCKQSD